MAMLDITLRPVKCKELHSSLPAIVTWYLRMRMGWGTGRRPTRVPFFKYSRTSCSLLTLLVCVSVCVCVCVCVYVCEGVYVCVRGVYVCTVCVMMQQHCI